MQQGKTVAVAAAAAVAAGLVVLRWKNRRRIGHAQGRVEPAARPAEPEDHCAICLEVPEQRCRTQCSHRFCLRCFRAWSQRQVPPTAVARCPLCMSAVTSLTPEFVLPADLSDTRWLWAYNMNATLTVRLRWVRHVADAARFACGGLACCAYVFAGHVWDAAHEAMSSTFAPVPVASDFRLRAASRWLVSAHLLSVIQRVLSPDQERNAGLNEIIASIRPVALTVIATL